MFALKYKMLQSFGLKVESLKMKADILKLFAISFSLTPLKTMTFC
jgi:hypothetical protein